MLGAGLPERDGLRKETAVSLIEEMRAAGRRRKRLQAQEAQWREDARSLAVQAWNDGESATHIGGLLGMNRSQVYRLLREAGIDPSRRVAGPVRDPGAKVRAALARDGLDSVEEAITRYGGLRAAERALGVPRSTLAEHRESA
jgi:hypothetical protein